MLVRSFEDNDRVSSKIRNVREILEIERILLENGKVVNLRSGESFEDSFLFVLEPESGDINEEIMDPTEMESGVSPCS